MISIPKPTAARQRPHTTWGPFPDMAPAPCRPPRSAPDALELLAIVHASHALARATERAELLQLLLPLVLQHSGAACAMFCLQGADTIEVVARAWSCAGRVEVRLEHTLAGTEEAPLSLLAAAAASASPISVCGASAGAPCSPDPYLRRHAPRSATAMPLLDRGTLAGLLYLEHRQLAGVFTQERLAVTALLATQAAISLGIGARLATAPDSGNAKSPLHHAQCELARVARVTAMGEFAASIAHDVNQPLAAIMLNANAAMGSLRQEPPQWDQARDALSAVLRAAKSASDITRSVHNLARKRGPELAAFPVDEAIEEVLLLLRSALNKHEIALRTGLGLGGLTVLADRVQLQQVVMNLCLNAIEAMATVTGRARLLEVRSAMADASGTLHISVEDNGCGIDAQVAARLFDPLFSTRADGMGMGLAICRSIAAAHGGRIWGSSRQPHGAVFHLSLPSGSLPP